MSNFACKNMVESPSWRVVFRGGNNANANNGLANTNANNDASNANSNVGSRLDDQQSVHGNVIRVSCSRTEGDEPRQKHMKWKAETSSVG